MGQHRNVIPSVPTRTATARPEESMSTPVAADGNRRTIPRWPVPTILAIAVFARLVAAFVIGSEFRFADEIDYVDAADRLLEGNGFDPHYERVPGYPVILGALKLVTPEPLVSLRAAHAILAGMGALALYLFVRRFAGYWPAVAAMLVYALDPLLVVTGALLYPETLTAVLLVLTCDAARAAHLSGRHSAAIAAGAGLGLICLLRPVGLTLIPAVALWLLLADGRFRARALAHACIAIVVALVLLTPWTIRNYEVHDRFVPIAIAGARFEPDRPGRAKPVAPPTSTEPDAAERTTPRATQSGDGLVGSILGQATNDPAAFVARTVRELGNFWELYPTRLMSDWPGRRAVMHAADPRLPSAETFPRSLRDIVSTVATSSEYLLALVGLALCFRWYRRETLLFLLVVTAYSLGCALFMAKLRYRIPILPIVFTLAGLGLAAIVERAFALRRAAPRS
jgi:4-amino-4-deoxy-L-arabinose transferase-like glycosyltransferase